MASTGNAISEEESRAQPGADLPGRKPDARKRTLAALAWLAAPVLAVVAFAPTLRVWFLSDDFGHLLFHQSLAFPRALIAFDNATMFYRPLSTILTWNLGYALFGTNALPYHIFSLLFHALAAFFLARAVAMISGDNRIGWLSGAIFAVYPLCTEPVVWLASQWDVMGAACVAGAVWGFASAWRSRRPVAYALGLAAAFLAVLMKESTLPLPAIIPFVALATELSPRVAAGGALQMARREWTALAKRILVWSVPFALPSILFAGLRLFEAGSIGGYPTAPKNFQDFFWDSMVAAALDTLAPLNRLVFQPAFVQVMGLAISGLLVVGLIVWGRKRWPLYLLAFVWWLAFIVPVLNLIVRSNNPAHENNREYYLSMMGFAIALAIPLAGFVQDGLGRFGRRAVLAGWAVVSVVLLAALPVTWIQLQPWVDASNQAQYVLDELSSLVAPMSSAWIDFNVKSLPDSYRGAYVFRNGLDTAMIGLHDQLTRVNRVQQLDPEQLAEPFGKDSGRYNLEFAFDPNTRLYNINKLSGITMADAPPAGAARVWDFRKCNTDMPGGWQVDHATAECAGTYLDVKASTIDPNLLLTGLNIDLTGKSWLRLGVRARYLAHDAPKLGELFWETDGSDTWLQNNSRSYFLDSTGSGRVYWTFIPVKDLGTRLNALRVDPVNDKLDSRLSWISIDVK
jgi:hypothetical protein